MIDNVLVHNADNYFERAVIATLSYFMDNDFKIAINLNQLDDHNVQPGIPENWRDTITIAMNITNNEERRTARYIVRKNSQTYTLSLSSECSVGSGSGTTAVAFVVS